MTSSDVRASLGPMTPLRKIYAGSDTRKTRLHDELGTRVPLGRLLRNGPRAVLTGAARVLFGWRQELPWISYDARKDLARVLTPRSKVLEFGSCMSTMWYSRHAGSVVSIEDYRPWFDLVSARIGKLGNVDYRFAADRAAYVALAPDQRYDLIMIDGSHRDDCVRFALEHLAPGGIIYLDNSDKGLDETTGNIPEAQRLLLAFAEREGLPVAEFTDFAPTQLHVQRGLWIGRRP
jgi:hypothetical protein